MSELHPIFDRIMDAYGMKPQETRFQQSVIDVFTEAKDTLISKHRDYGSSNISNAPGGALNGIRVRMHDKLARINNLLESDSPAVHEPLRDSFLDLANYALIGMLVIDGKWPNE